MKQKKEAARKEARTAGKTAKNTNTATRVERWRRLAEERIAQLDELKMPGLAILRTCAEIEGMAPADFVVKRLKSMRLGGRVVTERPKEYFSPEFKAYEDTDFELNASTRARNNHERDVVSSMVSDYVSSSWLPVDLAKKYGRRFALAFFHRGDNGLFSAFRRMASYALARCAANVVLRSALRVKAHDTRYTISYANGCRFNTGDFHPMGVVFHFGDRGMDVGPLRPLREVAMFGAFAKTDPMQTPDRVCRLVDAATAAALAAIRNGRRSGWLFGEKGFILGVRAIRDINERGAVETFGTDLEQRLPAAWAKMADTVELYAKDVPRLTCWAVGDARPPSAIPRDIISPAYGRPVCGDALQSLFGYCLAKALAAFPADRDLVETYYKTGVFNFPLNTTRALSRIEAGQGETRRRLETAEDRIMARLEVLQVETAGTKAAIEGVGTGVSILVRDREGKKAANVKRGKESHERAVLEDAERQRAERDVQTALKRVHDRVKGGQKVLVACRLVCSHFATLTDAKKTAPTYLPLTKADGSPYPPETLARYYRDKHKAKPGKK